MFPLAAPTRRMLACLSLLFLTTAGTALHAQEVADQARGTPPVGTAMSEAIETTLVSRNRVELELGAAPAALAMTIRSVASGRRLQGEVSFVLQSE